MKRFLHSDSFRYLLVVALVVLLGVFFAVFSHNASSPLTTAISTVFSPLQRLSAAIAEKLDDLPVAFTSSSVYKQENDDLRRQLEEYRRKLADYDEMKQKIDSYESLYEIKNKNPDFKVCAGTVVAHDAADAYGSFVLNVGTKDGVAVDDPVIYGQYVLGIVKKADLTTCVVCTVLDPRVNVAAYESGTREYGFVSGDETLFSKGLCRLSGLDSSTSVVSGGVVCTSGEGVFPAGLILGEVTAVRSDDVSASYYAEVKPYAELNEVSDVFVITDFEGKGR